MRELVVALCITAAVAFVAAQETPTFEVASVKQNTSGDGQVLIQTLPGNRINMTNVPARFLVAQAYQLQQIGSPLWPSGTSRRSGPTSLRTPAPQPPTDSLTPSSTDSISWWSSRGWVVLVRSSALAFDRFRSRATLSTTAMRMMAFYRDVLELEPIEETRLENWVEFRGDGVRFSLHAIPSAIATGIRIDSPPRPREQSSAKLTFAVQSVDTALQKGIGSISRVER